MLKRTCAILSLSLFLFFLPGGTVESRGEEIYDAAVKTSEAIPSLPDQDLEILIRNGELTRYYFENTPPRWLPQSPLKAAILTDINSLTTVVGVESVYLLSREEAGIPGEIDLRSGEFQLDLYNILRSIRSLKGIDYYSASRKTMRTLFAESYAIASPEETTPLPDPLAEEIPPLSRVYAFQEDLTFGKNIYELVYRHENHDTALTLTNKTDLRYGIFKMVEPEKMKTHLLIRPFDDYILFYGACTVETLRFLGLERSKKDSFYNRIQALYKWFTRQLSTLS